MPKLVLVVKFVLVSLTILIFIIISFIDDLLVIDKNLKLRNSTRLSSFICRLLIKILGVKISMPEKSRMLPDNNYLIVSNHLSYLDIFVLASRYPSVFIASVDGVKNAFILGTIARLGGGIFVDRLNRMNIKTEIDKISVVIKNGFSVIVFPEATTSNGDKVLDFKSSLFTPAINSGIKIQPLCIKYKKLNGKVIGEQNRDFVYYYGDAEFFTHFRKLISQSSIEVEVNLLEEIDTATVNSRKQATMLAFKSISLCYKA